MPADSWPPRTDVRRYCATTMTGRDCPPSSRQAREAIEAIPLADLPPDGVIFDAPPAMARAASEVGPIFRRRMRDGTDLVYLVGPEASRLVLYTHRDHFSHREGWTPVLGPYFGTGLLNMDGAQWAEQRRMMNPAFSAA